MDYGNWVRKAIYLVATVGVFGFPVALQQKWIPEPWAGRAMLFYLVFALILIGIEFADRRDFRDQLRVITEGISGVDSALEDLVSAKGNGRQGKFQELYKIANNAIVGLANTDYVQAQFFWVHQHGEHQHFVSIHTNNGKHEKSNNHFSSVGDKVDQLVWEQARERKTRIYRNLAWHRIGSMPPGFKRWQRKRYNTFITSPVYAGDNLIGLLTINSRVPFSLSQSDARIVESVARTIGIGASVSESLQKPKDYATISSRGAKGCRP